MDRKRKTQRILPAPIDPEDTSDPTLRSSVVRQWNSESKWADAWAQSSMTTFRREDRSATPSVGMKTGVGMNFLTSGGRASMDGEERSGA
jgi:hypothetical protein